MFTTTHSHKHWTDEGGHVNLIRISNLLRTQAVMA